MALLVSHIGNRPGDHPEHSGPIDATTCAGSLLAAYRHQGELRITRLAPTPPAEMWILDGVLDAERTAGDLAVAHLAYATL